MKSKYKGEVTRTSGWETQPVFDYLLSDLDISSLCFLNDKYKHDIRDFPNYFDFNNKEHYDLYREMLQRKRMIVEEIDARIMNEYTDSYSEESHFDCMAGYVYNNTGDAIYSIAYSEDESAIVYENGVEESFEEPDDYEEEPKTKIEIYANWNYQNEIKEA